MAGCCSDSAAILLLLTINEVASKAIEGEQLRRLETRLPRSPWGNPITRSMFDLQQIDEHLPAFCLRNYCPVDLNLTVNRDNVTCGVLNITRFPDVIDDLKKAQMYTYFFEETLGLDFVAECATFKQTPDPNGNVTEPLGRLIINLRSTVYQCNNTLPESTITCDNANDIPLSDFPSRVALYLRNARDLFRSM